MPYAYFNKRVKGKMLYCIRNLRTGKVVCYKSLAARKKGVRIREAFAHGWKPTRKG